MEMLSQSLPIVIYFLLIVLLIIVIVIGIRLIGVMNKVDNIVNDIDDKMQSLNGVFNLVDTVTSKANELWDMIFGILGNGIFKIFSKNKKSKKEESDYYE